jgi:hypothetical protein
MVMTNGIGANLTNDEKRAHLADCEQNNEQVQAHPAIVFYNSLRMATRLTG